MFPKELVVKAQHISTSLRKKKLSLCTAESCTGGLVASLFTSLPGSSDIFERGFVTYSNQAKIETLSVPSFFIEDYGAVSKHVAIAMAEGALLVSRASITIAVTGIAGPDGGSDQKPLGTVYIASSQEGYTTQCIHHHFTGNRDTVRLQAVHHALDMINNRL